MSDSEQRAACNRVAQLSIRQTLPDVVHFAVTLRDRDGTLDPSIRSHFKIHLDGPGNGYELLEATKVHPGKLTKMCAKVGHDWSVANISAQIAWFVRLGGHALEEQAMVRNRATVLLDFVYDTGFLASTQRF